MPWPWKWLTPDEWSALGTVVSAVVALLNLIVVVILLVYNRKTLGMLVMQTLATQAQAKVAEHTLSELIRETGKQNGREVTRTTGRPQDLNTDLGILLGVTTSLTLEAPQHYPVRPDGWQEMLAVIIEYWPDGMPLVSDLDSKLREIDSDLRLLSKSLTKESRDAGIAHLTQLLIEAIPLVRVIHSGLLGAVVNSA
jgi:hypothetical protein